MALWRSIVMASALTIAIAAVASAQSRPLLSLTPDQCAAAPDLDKALAEITACRDKNLVERTTTVKACMTWWRGWPTSCIVPPQCTAAVERYYVIATTKVGLKDARVVPGAGRAEAVNGQIKQSCASVFGPPRAPTKPTGEWTLSNDGRAFLKKHEKVVLGYYNDPSGYCTRGVGNLVRLSGCTKEELETKLTAEDVEKDLQVDIDDASALVRAGVPTRELTQAQFDALVTLTFNLRPAFMKGIYQLVERGDFAAAHAKILLYNKGRDKNGKKIVLPGLVTRRRAEAAPFPARRGASQ